MAKFKFRLEKVERVRQLVEEQKKQEWAIQEQQLRRQRAKLNSLLQQKNDVMEFGYKQNNIAIKTAMYHYLAVLNENISFQQTQVIQCEKKTASAKKEWFLALQEKEKVETLREKQYEEYRKKQLRDEQKVLDDMRSRVEGI